MSKKKGDKKKGPQPAQATAADDDLDALLAEFGTPVPAAVPSEIKSQPQETQGGEEDDDEGDGQGQGDKKKKKKKKKAAVAAAAPGASGADKKEEEAVEAPTSPAKESKQSAKGRLVAERLRKQREEEERLAKLRKEEEDRIREIERKEEEERQRILEEKERKRKAKKDKIDRQKKEGTYKTKAEKEKERRAKERLMNMVAAGIVNPSVLESQSNAPSEEKKSRVVYSRKKTVKKQDTQPGQQEQHEKEDEEDDEEPTEDLPADVSDVPAEGLIEPEPFQTEEHKSIPTAFVPSVDEDDWDSVPAAEKSAQVVVDDDDWENDGDEDDKLGFVSVQTVHTTQQWRQGPANFEDEEEDHLKLEQEAEQERLRKLGLERMERDRQRREKEEAERAEREAAEREAFELAQRKELSRIRRKERDEAAKAAVDPNVLRSPISVIMGHVDTGKTKLLDKIRKTNVQEGEAGGITQQIGATFFAKETLETQTAAVREKFPLEVELPGLLVIDTPGHESFTNLRTRGSSLCDIAILVIDLMHGLEPQTIESLNMLRRRNAPFVVALNKVDRCYGWKTCPNAAIRDSFEQQDSNTMSEFHDRAGRARVQLMEQGMNAELYWENNSPDDTLSLIPTSALTGEGVPDLIYNLIFACQQPLRPRLVAIPGLLQCTVLEVKVLEGLGTTIDCVLVNGTLKENDTIVVATMNGPVVTTIRAILTPPPSREMRVRTEFIHHREICGAIGVKLCANDLEGAVAGSPLMVVQPGDDVDDVKEDISSDFEDIMKHISKDHRGVVVQASTLGALEALLQYLTQECKPPVPVSAVNIGPVYKRDVMRANLMNEKGLPEYATILAFDVRVDSDAQEYAAEMKVRIFTADIIYHLFDSFTRYMSEFEERKRKEASDIAVFPCVLKILPQHIFNQKDPVICGVEVMDGIVKIGTPLIVCATGVFVGNIIGIENNHKEVPHARKGQSVSIKIANTENPNITFGRQFDHQHPLYSRVSRASIDALKQYFKGDMRQDDWALLVKLKKLFNVQ